MLCQCPAGACIDASQNARGDHATAPGEPVCRDMAVRLAVEFHRIVRRDLGEHLVVIDVRNASNPPDVCATHDFCDANMLMAEAWEAVFQRETDVANQAEADLWGDAWTVAVANGFQNDWCGPTPSTGHTMPTPGTLARPSALRHSHHAGRRYHASLRQFVEMVAQQDTDGGPVREDAVDAICRLIDRARAITGLAYDPAKPMPGLPVTAAEAQEGGDDKARMDRDMRD